MTELAFRTVLALVAASSFAYTSYRFHLLSCSGAVAAGMLALTLLFLGDPSWIVPGLTFFLSSSVLSFVGRDRKRSVSEKGSRRDAAQVLCNGGAAWLLLLLHAWEPNDVLYVGYLGAFAAAASDTWATEIGMLGRRPPRLITTLKPAGTGTSGAVSAIGTAAALAGAALIWASSLPFSAQPALVSVVGGGFAGSVLDSILGATLQQKLRWMTNDVVNLAGTAFGAIVAMTCFGMAVFGF
ncbi:MAG: DUF92 domain-containing protein [Rhodothermales bacterium]